MWKSRKRSYKHRYKKPLLGEALEQRNMFASLATLDVSSLLDTNSTSPQLGYVIDGARSGDWSGHAASSAGDVNGDGFDDILIGAPTASPRGGGSGATYVVFGKPTGQLPSQDLSRLDGTNGFVINGARSGDWSGAAVGKAGDFNGDGVADLIIGAPKSDPHGPNSGSAYVVFGSRNGFNASMELSDLNGTNGFVINGIAAYDETGGSVSGAGDVNGDGYDDVIIGAPESDKNGNRTGTSYLVYGRPGTYQPVLSLDSLNGSNGTAFVGIDANDISGYWVAGAGDVNGDGLDDIIIGAPNADPQGSDAGESNIVFGRKGGYGAQFKLSSINGANGFILNGNSQGHLSGFSASAAGDVNGDGYDDLIVGAFKSSPSVNGGPNRYAAGESYVVFGKANGFTTRMQFWALDGTNGFAISGARNDDWSGYSVSGAGDVNADGYDDILIGAPLADPRGTSDAGESYIVYGKSGGFGANFDLATINGSNGFRVRGRNAVDTLGVAVSGAGDVNGDGFADVLIAARWADPQGRGSAGQSVVIFGGDFNGVANSVGTTGDDSVFGSQQDERLISGQGNDIIQSGGARDVIASGQGADVISISDVSFRRISAGTGFDTLKFEGQGIALDLAKVPNSRLTGIEKIDMTGTGRNYLWLNVDEVLRLSDETNTLLIDTTTANHFQMGSGWTGAGTEMIDEKLYQVYTQGAATLKVHTRLGDITQGAEGVITISGTDFADTSKVDYDEVGQVRVTLQNTSGARELKFERGQVTKIVFSGGESNDTFINETEIPSEAYGGNDEDVLIGGSGPDMLHGGGGRDKLYGRGGDDRLEGHTGDDTLYGDEGNDHLYGEWGSDTLYGGDGDDELIAGRRDDDGDDIAYGENGNDRIFGGLGNDFLHGGDDDDLIAGQEGDDHIEGHTGNDTLYGDDGNDHIFGEWGSDILYGGNGDDELVAGRRDDDGDDIVYGENGNDRIFGGMGNDFLHGGEGDDLIAGQEGDDELEGGAGNDNLQGGEDNDFLLGEQGVDLVDGGDGNDATSNTDTSDTLIFVEFHEASRKVDIDGTQYRLYFPLPGGHGQLWIRTRDTWSAVNDVSAFTLANDVLHIEWIDGSSEQVFLRGDISAAIERYADTLALNADGASTFPIVGTTNTENDLNATIRNENGEVAARTILNAVGRIDYGNSLLGTGILLDWGGNQFVLTSNHIVFDLATEKIRDRHNMTFNVERSPGQVEVYRVHRIIADPTPGDVSGAFGGRDLALLQLDRPVANVYGAVLPKLGMGVPEPGPGSSLVVNRKYLTVGYGTREIKDPLEIIAPSGVRTFGYFMSNGLDKGPTNVNGVTYQGLQLVNEFRPNEKEAAHAPGDSGGPDFVPVERTDALGRTIFVGEVAAVHSWGTIINAPSAGDRTGSVAITDGVASTIRQLIGQEVKTVNVLVRVIDDSDGINGDGEWDAVLRVDDAAYRFVRDVSDDASYNQYVIASGIRPGAEMKLSFSGVEYDGWLNDDDPIPYSEHRISLPLSMLGDELLLPLGIVKSDDGADYELIVQIERTWRLR